jgi:hypothetical protein
MIDVPDQDCEHLHTLRQSLRGLRAVYRDPRPLTERRGAHGWHFVICTRTVEAREQARRKLLRWRQWRRQHPWLLAWERLPSWEQSWADSTAFCETGGTMDPRIHSPGGLYHGLMQFDLRTASLAGFTRDPHLTSANEQKVRGVRYMLRQGTSPWPNCG